MQPMYEFLYRTTLLKGGKPNIDLIKRLSKNKILKYAEEIISINKKQEISRENSIFAQSASHSLGGGIAECSYIGCRINRIENLARYSLLYADRVYIEDFFIPYMHYQIYNLTEIRKRFYDDLFLLAHIQPFIERGYIRIFTPKSDVCIHCLSYQNDIKYLSDEQLIKIGEIREDLLLRFLNETKATFRKKKGNISIILNGPEDLFTHSTKIFPYNSDKGKKLLEKIPYIKERLQLDNEFPIPKEILPELNFHVYLTNDLLRDISFQMLLSNTIGTSFLSDNSACVSFLNTLTSDSEISRRNYIAERYLTTFVPFLEDVPLIKIMKIRDREEESVLNFRTAMNQAISEYSQDKQFSEVQAKQIYSEIISPSLLQMEKRFNQAKIDLIKNIGSKVLGTGVALGFGIYSGIIPTNLIEIANALGLVNIVSEIVQQASTFNSAEKIKSDSYYFLLKLKKQAKE